MKKSRCQFSGVKIVGKPQPGQNLLSVTDGKPTKLSRRQFFDDAMGKKLISPDYHLKPMVKSALEEAREMDKEIQKARI